ncbi:hypothetical protein [Mycolicibacterium palauense]|uniref:hypothetical protein n=1 Tax=Mycolicibacterium palauense TaxID=2034511 RepID=UPI0011455324|nr:hypothetical protein [Mycolicibacterium palauense]
MTPEKALQHHCAAGRSDITAMNSGGNMADGMGVLTKPLMFLSSYAPLFGMLAIRFEDSQLRILFGVLAFAGLMLLPLILAIYKTSAPADYTICAIDPAGNGASAYLAGYLLPFLTTSNPTTPDLAAYGLFLVVAYLVHIRTDMIQVNPTLFVFGWRVYAFTDTNGLRGHLVCRTRVLVGDDIVAYRISDDLLLMAKP